MNNSTTMQDHLTLKLGLARLVSFLIGQRSTPNAEFYWTDTGDNITEREWFHICNLIEQMMTEEQCREYNAQLSLRRGLNYKMTHRLQDYNPIFSDWPERATAILEIMK